MALAPAVLLAGFVSHPYIGMGPPNESAIAAAVVAETTRWGLSHLAVSVGSALVVLAFLAIRSYLREAGEERWSAVAFPFIIIGSTLFAVLPGMEFAPLVAAETGGDVAAGQAALFPWFVPVLLTGAFTFGLGVLGFVMAIVDRGVLNRRLTWLVVGALAVMAVARFVPLGAVQLYVQGAAGIVALWPLSYEIWKHPIVERRAAQPRRPSHVPL
ncbi:MAG: hypothetical protein M3252_09175 [Actinomycetota bacterium]|nr:hypothetical protein [Actinomycetota bacterium]